jgi:hypothetical protein
MLKRIAVAGALIAAVAVGIVAGWQFGVFVVFLAVLVFGFGHVVGVGMDASTRWSSAMYGDDPDDASHWNRTGGRRRR